MLKVNFHERIAQMKPMHGVGQPPFYGSDFSMFRYLKEAGIPYSRLHDVGGWLGGGLYVDIPNLFRDFNANENDPSSYDFAFTDRLLKAISDSGVEPFFRLGITIENSYHLKSYRVFPPSDPEKWARICEHIVRHYNEGWANGFHMGITYWEVWNEPDNNRNIEDSPMWKGTDEQYFELYDHTAKRLKKCFGDSIKVGGFASCGFYGRGYDPDANGQYVLPENPNLQQLHFLTFFHDFLDYVKEHGSPLDYFSWHSYEQVPQAVESAKYCRKVLNYHGFHDVPDILNEWNPTHTVLSRSTQMAAARALAFMIAMQGQTVAEMNFYDARIGPSCYGGLFNPDTWTPYRAYYVFKMFNDAYRLENQTVAESDDSDVYCLSAANENNSVILLANHVDKEKTVSLSIDGAKGTPVIIRHDDAHICEETTEILGDTLVLPPYGCVEIRFQA